jgi:membrane-bound metal-dependent hydrolase YbcI (DUF457 family)
MMNKSHATMAGCALAGATSMQFIPWAEPKIALAIYSLVMAGSSWPDGDHKQSVVTHSWGLLTKIYCRIIRLISRIVYLTTRARDDPIKRDPHRTFTHSWPGCVFQGGMVALGMHSHQLACTGILALLLGTAFRVFGKKNLPWGAVIGGGIGWSLWPTIGQTWWILWVAMSVGCYLHVLTDCVTKAGAPLRFPNLVVKKVRKKDGSEKVVKEQRWYMTGPPDWMQFRTGGLVEKAVVLGTVGLTLFFCYWMFSVLVVHHGSL